MKLTFVRKIIRLKSFWSFLLIFLVLSLCFAYAKMPFNFYIKKSEMDISSKLSDIVAENGSSSKKKIALTFDDGPSDKTLDILEILKRQNVVATFFVVGKYVEERPDVLKKVFESGNQIGNHSYSHSKNLAKMKSDDMLADVLKTEKVIEVALGQKNFTKYNTKLFRPPYGIVSFKMERVLREAGYEVILWDIDPKDWDVKSNGDKIEKNILSSVLNNSVILLHDGKSTYSGTESKKITDANTELILEDLILKLKENGYEFVTLDNLY